MKIHRIGMVVGALGLLAFGCARKTAESPSQSVPSLPSTTKGQAVELEMAIFQGGYGLDFFEKKAQEYAQQKGLKVKVWGNPRIWEQLRTRFVAGDVPDLTWPGWGMDVWALVYEGQVKAMDEELAKPAWEQNKPWKDTFIASLLDRGKYEGHYYILPFNYNVFAWWYNVKLFQKHGWKPPTTWDELLALSAQIKAAGIAPLTFQGHYPDYMLRGFFYPWAISVGGLQAYEDAQNLKPGAWSSTPFLKAAEMIAELRDKGYFQKGAMGMEHTQAQMEFVEGRAAMIPCGTWLYSEMKDQMPPGFEMDFLRVPAVVGGKGDPTYLHAAPETWIIPAQGRHPELGADLFRYMTSLENAKQFVAEKHTLMAIQGSDQVELPRYLAAPAQAMREAKAIWHADHTDWYPQLKEEFESALAALLNAEITPQECVEKMEKAATKAREDKRLPKHTVHYSESGKEL